MNWKQAFKIEDNDIHVGDTVIFWGPYNRKEKGLVVKVLKDKIVHPFDPTKIMKDGEVTVINEHGYTGFNYANWKDNLQIIKSDEKNWKKLLKRQETEFVD